MLRDKNAAAVDGLEVALHSLACNRRLCPHKLEPLLRPQPANLSAAPLAASGARWWVEPRAPALLVEHLELLAVGLELEAPQEERDGGGEISLLVRVHCLRLRARRGVMCSYDFWRRLWSCCDTIGTSDTASAATTQPLCRTATHRALHRNAPCVAPRNAPCVAPHRTAPCVAP